MTLSIVDGWVKEAKEYNLMANSMSRNGLPLTHLVIHGTAGGSDGASIAAYMAGASVSTHFIISTDGTVYQLVSLDVAAWANAPLNQPRLNFRYAAYNPNFWTCSIEFAKPDTTNGINITDAQKRSGFPLILAICNAYNIPKRKGDGNSGIIAHADLNSVDRSRCPGTFPWDELYKYLAAGGNTVAVPEGWQDKNGVVTAPNNVSVKQGFADYIRKNDWDGKNLPIENEQAADPVEDGFSQDPNNGTRQLFNYSELAWTSKRGVYLVGIGNELKAVRKQRDDAKAQATKLQQQITTLQSTDAAKLQAQVIQLQAQIQSLQNTVGTKNSALAGIATAAQAASK